MAERGIPGAGAEESVPQWGTLDRVAGPGPVLGAWMEAEGWELGTAGAEIQGRDEEAWAGRGGSQGQQGPLTQRRRARAGHLRLHIRSSHCSIHSAGGAGAGQGWQPGTSSRGGLRFLNVSARPPWGRGQQESNAHRGGSRCPLCCILFAGRGDACLSRQAYAYLGNPPLLPSPGLCLLCPLPWRTSGS